MLELAGVMILVAAGIALVGLPERATRAEPVTTG
jgi:hypothetical protein